MTAPRRGGVSLALWKRPRTRNTESSAWIGGVDRRGGWPVIRVPDFIGFSTRRSSPSKPRRPTTPTPGALGERLRSLSKSESRYGTAMAALGRDRELVERANRGDAAAFEQLYQYYRNFVFGLALRRLGNPDDAFDVVQDTFINLFSRFPGFELTAAMASFLSRIVEHLCRDHRARQRPVTDIDTIGDVLEAVPVVCESAGEYGTGLLLGLQQEQRDLLTLRFVDDLSLPQLAEKLDVPVGTVKSRLHRAIAALRDKVGKPRWRA